MISFAGLTCQILCRSIFNTGIWFKSRCINLPPNHIEKTKRQYSDRPHTSIPNNHAKDTINSHCSFNLKTSSRIEQLMRSSILPLLWHLSCSDTHDHIIHLSLNRLQQPRCHRQIQNHGKPSRSDGVHRRGAQLLNQQRNYPSSDANPGRFDHLH